MLENWSGIMKSSGYRCSLGLTLIVAIVLTHSSGVLGQDDVLQWQREREGGGWNPPYADGMRDDGATAARRSPGAIPGDGDGPSAAGLAGLDFIDGVPPGFEVVVIRESNTVFLSVPDINNLGEIVWQETRSATDSNIYLYREGEVTKISDESLFNIRPVINNTGTIAWIATDDTSNAEFDLVLHRNGVPTTIFGLPSGEVEPDINDVGQVVWTHVFQGEPGHFGIFLYDGQTVEEVSPSDLGNQSPRINNAGDVLWNEVDFTVSPSTAKIKLRSNGVITDLSDGVGRPAVPDMNEQGQVIWTCRTNCDQLGVYTWENGSAYPLVRHPFTFRARINDPGDVAFGCQDTGEKNDVLLKTNGQLYRLPDQGTSYSGGGINNDGAFVWRGSTDTTDGLFLIRKLPTVAGPTALPAVSQVGVVVIVAFMFFIGLAVFTQRRRERGAAIPSNERRCDGEM
jgi:hypothetical protein